MYPRAVELFALQNDRSTRANKIFFTRGEPGPPKIELGVAKKNSITIMRLPRWKRLIAKSEALKSDLVLMVFAGCSLL
jgi:hypothetical protein